MIQETLASEIRERGATVVTIAHRILTIIKNDRILLLEDGKALEFGLTAELLSKEGGAFRSLALAAGIDLDQLEEGGS